MFFLTKVYIAQITCCGSHNNFNFLSSVTCNILQNNAILSLDYLNGRNVSEYYLMCQMWGIIVDFAEMNTREVFHLQLMRKNNVCEKMFM